MSVGEWCGRRATDSLTAIDFVFGEKSNRLRPNPILIRLSFDRRSRLVVRPEQASASKLLCYRKDSGSAC